MAKKSRTKGATGEREWAAWLTEHTPDHYKWERNGRNGIGSADVISPNGGKNYEVKRRQSLQWLQRGMQQAKDEDAHLALRFDNDEWWVAMPATEYVKLEWYPWQD